MRSTGTPRAFHPRARYSLRAYPGQQNPTPETLAPSRIFSVRVGPGRSGWVLSAQLCFSNVSLARRLKAIAATVLSTRGAVIPQVQWEQH